MEGNKPFGGQWNFDQKNRQTYDRRVPIPPALLFENDARDVCQTLRRMKVQTFGEIEDSKLIWPTTRTQSLELLKTFANKGLAAFGTYQDAMTAENWYLFHSRLSFALNTKMLRPLEVIQVALKAWRQKKSKIQIQQIEGFVRQILGLIATKPYISSAKYINSMSDYCKTCNYDWKKRHGVFSCPFNSFYWDFFDRHRRRLGKNARVAMMYRVWDRLGSREKKAVLNQAAAYRKKLNRL